MADPTIFVDGLSQLPKGINSGVPPLALSKDQLSFAINVTAKENYITHRPVYVKQEMIFGGDSNLQGGVEQGLYQGGCYYKPDAGAEYLVAQIGGRLFTFTPSTTRDVAIDEVTIPGDPDPSTTSIAYLWQGEKWVIVQDGQSIPIFYDGTSSRRSNSTQTVLGTVGVAGFTAPAIGAQVDIPLVAPFTGQIGDSFFIRSAGASNGRTYQATYPLATANATVTNLVDPAASHAAGEQVVINPNIFGVQLTNLSLAAGAGTHAAGTFSITLTLSQPTAFPLGTDIIILGKIYRLISIAGSFALFQNRQTVTILPTDNLPLGTRFLLSGTSFPVITVGTLTTGFTTPAIGAPVDIILDNPYTGTNGQVVYVGANGQYTIDQKPPPPAGLTLRAININDTVGNAVVSGDTLRSIPELPPGRMGVYGMGRIWMALTDGRSFIGSDIVGSTSGTVANQFRDSILKTTENTYLAGGGVFLVPGNIGDIQAMIFTSTLDTSLGQGPLQVLTPTVVFSVNAPVDRTTWQQLQNPILTQSLISNGGLAQNSTVAANGDTLFRAIDGIRSLILARREFATWGNTPISHEMERVIQQDDPAFLQYGSAVVFDNRLLMTSKPTQTGQGIIHRGLMALNFAPLSSIGEKSPSIWEGLWLGLNVLQVIRGSFSNVQRCFAFCYNNTTLKIELYELLDSGSETEDFNGAHTPITWQFETACLFSNVKGKNLFDVVKLLDGELYVAEVAGRVSFEVFYRPQFDPCWHAWHSFSICASENDAPTTQRQNRVMLGLGAPPADDCDPANKRAFYVAETFQVKIKITGHCKFYGLLAKACAFPRPAFSKVVCGDQECRLESCPPDNDYGVYTLQDDSPIEPTADFFNEQVVFPFPCEEGTTLTFTGTLPSWITIDTENSQLVGAAGTFRGVTQEAANLTAQQNLDDFANDQIGNGNITCESDEPPASCEDGGSDTNRYSITGYSDGTVLNAPGAAPPGGAIVWNGQFTYKSSFNNCRWLATYNGGPDLSMDTRWLCNCTVGYSVSDNAWVLEFIARAAGPTFVTLWRGIKTTGTTPAGVYDLSPGDSSDVGPLTLTVASIGGATVNHVDPVCFSL